VKIVARLFLLFTLVSVVEVYLLLKVAQITSWWVTAAMVFVPGILGAWLAKREGAKAIREVGAALSLQREPTEAILDGAIVLVAAAFLIAPGVLTDLTGLALLVPPVRRMVREAIRARVRRAIDRKIASGGIRMVDFRNFGPMGGRDYDVIDAEDIPKRP
jgi:UPF0716 protein FxsA